MVRLTADVLLVSLAVFFGLRSDDVDSVGLLLKRAENYLNAYDGREVSLRGKDLADRHRQTDLIR